MSVKLEDIVSLAKRRGFIYQGSEIYGGLAGTWDYGPLGVNLKYNLTNLWWQKFVTGRDDIYPVDAAILMNQKVWQASGHATGFNDPMVECSNCKSRLRADHVEGGKCSVCGKEGTLSEPRQFNMMFKTTVGPVDVLPEIVPKGEGNKAFLNLGGTGDNFNSSVTYLRPETAQGIFTNYKNVVDSFYPDMPFGMAQIGKAFRNEISPRDFVFRSREMEQMEIEYFVKEAEWQKYFEHWQGQVNEFLAQVGVADSTHEREIEESDRAHYSKRTIDFEYDFPFGRSELLGLAYRGDYDLSKHQEHSGKNMAYTPKGEGKPFVPHVIEPSFGVDRLMLAVLCSAYCEDEQGGEKRVFLKLPYELAPVKVAVSPLLKNKPELVAKAREVYAMLKKANNEGMLGPRTGGTVAWDDNGNIGKRYRRQDEIGTPYCVTIDFDTLAGDSGHQTVTVRNRDTTDQDRININDIVRYCR